MIAVHFPKSIEKTVVKTMCNRTGRTLGPKVVCDAKGKLIPITLKRNRVRCITCRTKLREARDA